MISIILIDVFTFPMMLDCHVTKRQLVMEGRITDSEAGATVTSRFPDYTAGPVVLQERHTRVEGVSN